MKRASLSALTFLSVVNLFAQANGPYFLSADSLQRHERIWLNRDWKYHAGDDIAWAKPEFDDSAWETTATTLAQDHLPPSGWPGLGWFRIHLRVDSTLWQKPLILALWQAGAATIYLNSQLIYDYGNDGSNPQKEESKPYRDYAVFSFDNKPQHVFSIRYANYSTATFHQAGREAGFYFSVGHAGNVIEAGSRRDRSDLTFQLLFTALALAFGILHLVLFLCSPYAKSHLYFAIFVFLYAGNIFFDYQSFLANDIRSHLTYLRIHRAVMPLSPIFALLFIYSLFAAQIPKQFWLIALGLMVAGFFAVLKPLDNLRYILLFIGAVFVETIRVTRQAAHDKKDGAWIIVTGFMILGIFSTYDVLLDFAVISPINEITNGYPMGFLGLIISMSIYLARDFARTNEKLLAQERQAREREIQQRLLEADNARKTKELQAARQLQLAMLPQSVPQLPNLDIAVYMNPASEVGGDYYDFNLAEDGTLTVAIGDATGHGMQAGTVVAAAKSLFQVLAQNSDGTQIFRQFNQTLKSMNLGRIYMAMTLIKFKHNRIKVVAAGMPPVLLYRTATRRVEEINIKAMPLGSFAQFPYRQEEFEMASGDTIILMSDGLPEMFNQDGEILDYPRAKEIFAEVADQSPDAIIAHLKQAGEKWANGRPQQDDVTFVVMKVTRRA